jgi:hypothetical protein
MTSSGEKSLVPFGMDGFCAIIILKNLSYKFKLLSFLAFDFRLTALIKTFANILNSIINYH